MAMQRRHLTPEEDALEHIIACKDKPFLEERFIDSFKGRGVFTHKDIKASSFVVEYRGNVFCKTDTPQRKYDETPNNYLFEFTWNGAQWCIDASKEDRSLGRLVNDDHISPNCEIRTVVCEGKPHLCLFALTEIILGEEITYNYGDSSYPWRSMLQASYEGSSTSYPDFYTTSTPTNKRLEDSPASSFGNSSSDDDPDIEPANSGISHNDASFADINTQLDFRDSSPFAHSSREMTGSFAEPADDASSTQQEDEAPLSCDEVSSDADEGTSRRKRIPETRSWTSNNYCYVCGKGVQKVVRHFLRHADEEPEIAEALALPKSSKDRKKKFDELRKWGNYLHNKEVLKSNNGKLKLRRRPKSQKISAKTFEHCIHCKGMYLRKELWRHISRCPSRPAGNFETSTTVKGSRKKVLGEIALSESPYAKNLTSTVRKILVAMNQDLIASAVYNDSLLIQLAQNLSEKYRNNPSRHEYMRQRLREMGRLLLTLHQKSIYSFEDAMKPRNVLKVVESINDLAGFDQKRHGYSKPGLALKLTHSLKKLGQIVIDGDDCDDKKLKEIKTFMKLCTKDWSELVSHKALASRNGRRINRPSTIPFTCDVQVFFMYLEKTSASAVENMKTSESPQVYRALCRVTLAQASVLSKYAPEVSKMTLKTFQEREDSTQVLSKHFLRINIPCKTSQNVAVLLTSQLVSAITLLVSKRSACGVHAENPFLFAKPNSSPTSLFHGGNCIRAFSSLCHAKNPEHLRSVHHYKHIARVFQILNLENDELVRLAKLLGQDIRADRDYYRLPEAAVELAKISKLLLAMEKGSLEKFKGNSLDEIEIEDELEPDLELVIPKNCYAKEDNEESEDFVQQSEAAEQQASPLTPEQDALEHIKAWRDKPFLEERFINPIKGKGVFTRETIEPSSFVVEFRGKIKPHKEKTLKNKWQDAFNDYVFDFSWNETYWRIDASKDNGTLGRLVNDDHINPNCEMKKIVFEGKPHLCLFAVTEISPGEEITYNYGADSYPWRPKERSEELDKSQGDKDAAASPAEDDNAEDSCCDEDYALSTSNQQDQSSTETESSDDFSSDEEVKKRSPNKNYCFVCGGAYVKLSRHLPVHRNEVPEIAQLVKIRKNSKERKEMIGKLRERGNEKHNQEVLKTGCGELKVKRKRRSNKNAAVAAFIACFYCKGVYTRADMVQHLKICSAKKLSKLKIRGRTQIFTLVASGESADPENIPAELNKMLESLKDDEISSEARKDSLILQLAQCLVDTCDKGKSTDAVKLRVREMGRLLLILKKKSIYNMEEAIKPQNFSKVVEAVKELTSFNVESKSCTKVSVMKNVGLSLKKIGDINYARALKEKADQETVSQAQEFMMLCSKEWSQALPAKANPQTIPFIQDVQLYYQCLEKTAASGAESLSMYACAPVFTALLRVTVAQVTVFNKNMSEVSKATLKSFKERAEAELQGDAAASQSQLEQILSKHIVKINVKSQNDQILPVTLTPELLAAITLLVEKREACGVHPENPFLFGKPDASSSSFFSGGHCASTFRLRCGAKNVSNLGAAPFHKHVLRVFQILSLTNEELDQLAKVLGRNIQTDREYYQTPEAAVDVAKISELLAAMENGSLERFEGKSFEEMEVPDELEPEVEQPNEEALLLSSLPFEKGTAPKPKKPRKVYPQKKRSRARKKKKPQSDEDESDLEDERNNEGKTKSKKKKKQSEEQQEEQEEEEQPEERPSVCTPEQPASRRNDDITRMSFSDGDDDMDVDFDLDTDDEANREDGDTTKQNDDSRTEEPEDTSDFDAVHNLETEDQKKEAKQNPWMGLSSRTSSDTLKEEKKKKLLAAVAGMKEAKILLKKLDIEKYQASAKSTFQEDNNQRRQRSINTTTSNKPSLAKVTEMICSFCGDIMMKGQTAYQKKGFNDVFCSKNCLFQMFPINKPAVKTCHYCVKAISQPQDLIMAAVDNKGTMKDFCSVTCLISFKSDTVPTLCSMCSKLCSSTCELRLKETVNLFCSVSCMEDFRRENVDVCENCNSSCLKHLTLKLNLEDEIKIICDKECLEEFKEDYTTSLQCTMCHSSRPVSKMVDYMKEDNIVELFCDSYCKTSYKLGQEMVKPADEKSLGSLSKRKRGRPRKIPISVEERREETVNSEDVNISTNSAVTEPDAPAAAESDPIISFLSTDKWRECCSLCGKRLELGQMIYRPKNKRQVYCSNECFLEKFPTAKLLTKTCYNCQKVIVRLQSLITAPVDDSGTMRELCSNTCLASINSKRKTTAHKVPAAASATSKCKMCGKDCTSWVRVDSSQHSFCSEACFLGYNKVNNLPACDICSRIGPAREMLMMQDGSKNLCSEECLVKYKERIRAPRLCPMCQTSHQLSDMVESKNADGLLDFFCSNRCMMVHQAQSSTASGRNSPPSGRNSIIEVKPSPDDDDIKEVKPTLINLDFIKEEPIDEGYSQNPPPSVSTENIKDEPKAGDEAAKEDLKIDSVFSLTANSSTSTEPSSLAQRDFPASCFNCKQVLPDGGTVYQRKGHADVFCSTPCIMKFYQNAPVKRTECHFCLQDISQNQDVLRAPVDNEGTMKDFCSKTCLSSFNYKRVMSSKIRLRSVTSHSQCSMCSRYCISKRELIHQDSVHKVCSDPCFLRFCNLNKFTICEHCRSRCSSPLVLRMEDGCKNLCNAECLAEFKKKIKKLQPCAMCRISLLMSNMTEHKNSEDVVELFCTRSCVIASKIQAKGSPLNCDQCGKNKLPACHLAMSDDSIRNFCTLTCAMSFKESQKETSTASDATGAADQTKSDFGKPPEKLPCAQCQRVIRAAPKVIQRKGKLIFVCSAACSQEFKKVNNIFGRCEYCKNETIISDVKRVNGRDCDFCSDDCLMMFQQELEQKWGEHCGSCAYCFCISQTAVTAKFDGVDLEFCSENCSSNYNMLHCRDAKCDTCSRDGKLRQKLPLLGEVKHFCDLKCLLHFCNKKLQMVDTVAPPPPAADSGPVIANVISLAGALAMRLKADAAKRASACDIQTKVVGHASIQTVPTQLKNKSMLCTPLVHNKGVSCTTQTADTAAQTDNSFPKVIVLPLPVPVYVPLPLNMYSQLTPQPLGLPLPLPVPVFLPEPEGKSMKEKIHSDPLQGETEPQSEQETKDAREDSSSESSADLTSDDQATFSNQDDFSSDEDPPPLSSRPNEPQTESPPPPPPPPPPPASQHTIGKVHNKNKGRKLNPSPKTSEEERFTSRSLSKLQSQRGVDAWRRWIQWRKSHSNLLTATSRALPINEEVLRCSAAELSDGLCCFIAEVKRRSGEPYSPDSLFYLCLGIQQYLFDNNRLENIFSDLIYSRFSTNFTKILRGFKASADGSCVDEEFLWDCKQLGTYSPIILVNTLLFFCCKHFGFTSVEQHRQLAFAHVTCRTRTSPNKTKTSFLRFYPPLPKTEGESDDAPAKKRKKTEGSEDFLEMMENTENPLRCPVRLYEFYLSKCPESVRRRSDLFYLRPDPRCVSSSPLWFSSTPLDDRGLEAMLVRSLAVRGLQGGDGGGAGQQAGSQS